MKIIINIKSYNPLFGNNQEIKEMVKYIMWVMMRDDSLKWIR